MKAFFFIIVYLEYIEFVKILNFTLVFILFNLKKVAPQNTISITVTFLVLVILFSCGIKKNSPQETKLPESNPKLVFLNYTISKNEYGKKQMAFLNKIVTDGKLKNNKFPKIGAIGDLKCTQLDKHTNPLQSVIIKNPLSQVIEFVNDSLIFEKKQINLDSRELSLRLQLDSKTKSILISEIIDSLQNTKALIKTELY